MHIQMRMIGKEIWIEYENQKWHCHFQRVTHNFYETFHGTVKSLVHQNEQEIK